MDNEATKSTINEKVVDKKEKTGNKSSKLKMAAVAAAGVAAGAGATAAANNMPAESEIPVLDVQQGELSDKTGQSNDELTNDNDEIEGVVIDESNEKPVEETVPSDEEIPSDGEYIDDTSTNESDNDVHIIGVQAVPTEQGEAIIVGLEASNGDQALLVDVDSDGRIDLLVHDDNGNGVIDDNEVVDISGENISTGAMIAEYEQEQMTENIACNDDGMPDYMSDADVSMM